jgi:hypothetical protein
VYQNLNKKYNILYSDYLIYDLYVCTCVFLLHQEFFDMILINNLSFYDRGVTPRARQSRAKGNQKYTAHRPKLNDGLAHSIEGIEQVGAGSGRMCEW